MPSRILVVADEPWVRNEVHAALTQPQFELVDHADPETVIDAIVANEIDAVVADLQVASMGGMAVTRAVLQRASLDGRAATPVIILLDRAADAFLAKRAGAKAWVQKPFTARQLRDAIAAGTMATITPGE